MGDLNKTLYDDDYYDGYKEGVDEINALNSWLFGNGRAEDVQRGSFNITYQKVLLDEYNRHKAMVEAIETAI